MAHAKPRAVELPATVKSINFSGAGFNCALVEGVSASATIQGGVHRRVVSMTRKELSLLPTSAETRTVLEK